MLGREFPERLLRAIADAPERLDADLRDLTRLEFLHERSDAEERGYVFKHALTQDVAHDTLVRRAGARSTARRPTRWRRSIPSASPSWRRGSRITISRRRRGRRPPRTPRRAATLACRAWANAEALARYDQALHAGERGRAAGRRARALLQARAEVHGRRSASSSPRAPTSRPRWRWPSGDGESWPRAASSPRWARSGAGTGTTRAASISRGGQSGCLRRPEIVAR